MHMDTDPAVLIALSIEAHRKDQGMTEEQLSSASLIPLRTLKRRLAGDGLLGASEIYRLSKALGLPHDTYLRVAA